jgi:hypothetical protein
MMVKKKKTAKRRTKSKRTAGHTAKAMKARAKSAKKKIVAKKASKKKAAPKKPTARKKSAAQDTWSAKKPPVRSGRQAGDLQGLSTRASANSESVDELIEEGNAFEAEVVAGVENADNSDEKEVRTHEVPEDDVPGEYLDEG